ncbi:MAG: DUF935 family protein [Sphingomonadales bacterium]|nr:DUF935 family protein [Sphingomonadales bacterium]
MTAPKGERARAAKTKLPPELAGEIATTADGRDITQPFITGLREPKDPRLAGSVDWGIYDRILLDDQVFSTLQQRRGAVVARTWDVVAGDETDPRSVAAAEAFSNTIDRIGWDRITGKMLFAVFYGFAVAEIMWEVRDGLIDIAQIKVRHARRFRYDVQGHLRLLTSVGGLGEILHNRKFWSFRVGGTNDDEPYGRGLAEWLYWPTLFKRNGIRFWNIFLDKFGSPTAVGKYRPGTPKSDQEKLLEALQALSTDSGITIPEGMVVELLEAARSGTADYGTMVRYMDGAIAKIILSQTMTTDNGSSRSQAEVHSDVKLEVVKSDADLLSDSFAEVARWWTDLNFGTDVAAPRVMRQVAEEEDVKEIAETDEALDRLGWERTDESFSDTYGEGYRRKPKAEGPTPADGDDVDVDNPDDDGANDNEVLDPNVNDTNASFAADDPRPLYVYRPLLPESAAELLAWAVQEGFTALRPAASLHATIAYSKRPVNWMKMGGFWGWGPDTSDHMVPIGGPRIVDRIGDEGVVALHFFSGHLEQRNREMRDRGASWDFPDYFPHITFADDAGDVDLTKVKPFRGELRFGAEVFEQLDDDWQPDDDDASFAEGPADSATDQLVDKLIAEDGYRAVRALTEPMLSAIRAARSPGDLLAAIGIAPGNPAPIAADLEAAGLAAALDAESPDA